MAYRKTFALAVLIAGMTGTTASAWEHQFERGLDLYTTPDRSVGLSLVCDPNTVYGSSESAVLVQLGTDPMATDEVVFRFEDGIAVQASVVRGHIMKLATEEAAWQSLLAGFRQFSSVVIENDVDTVTVDLGEPVVFSCT